jgi:hypothetical protein
MARPNRRSRLPVLLAKLADGCIEVHIIRHRMRASMGDCIAPRRRARFYVGEGPLIERKTPVLTGGCQCGAVRYALMALPDRVPLCHCRMCQKAVGGPFAAFARVRRTDLVWTRGAPASFAGSSIAHRGFCANCGTPLSFRYEDGDSICVTLGSLDRPQDVVPTSHLGVESRIGWLDGLAALPLVPTDGDMTADRRHRYVNYQHPDHDTPANWAPPR